jgi:SAM-dependent methyltransferase
MPDAPSLEDLLDLRLDQLTALVDAISAEAATLPHARALRVIEQRRGEVQQAMAGLGEWIIDFEATHPSSEATEAARKRLAAPLSAWAQTAPTRWRFVFDGPRGASFELAELLSHPLPAGADIPALIFDDYLRQAPLTQSYITHVKSFAPRLREEVAAIARNVRVVRVLSLYYSGGTEVTALAEDEGLAGRVQLTVVDTKSDALRNARRKLSRLLGQRIHLERREPLQYLLHLGKSTGQFDLIYVFSRMVVLNTSEVIALLNSIHHALRPGGVLLTGNVTPRAPREEMALRKWWLGWQIETRDAAAWQAIAARTPFGAGGLQCIPEPGGMGLIIRGEKAD